MPILQQDGRTTQAKLESLVKWKLATEARDIKPVELGILAELLTKNYPADRPEFYIGQRFTFLHRLPCVGQAERWIRKADDTTYRAWVCFDFDDKENPARALDDARYFVGKLSSRFGLLYHDFDGPDDGHFFACGSGRKGIRVYLRHLTPEGPAWMEAMQAFGQAELEDFPTLDVGLYTQKTIRAPMSLHPDTGAFQVPLPMTLFLRGTWDDIMEACRPSAARHRELIELGLPAAALPLPDDAPKPVQDFFGMLARAAALAVVLKDAERAAMSAPARQFDVRALLDASRMSYTERDDGFRLRKCPLCSKPEHAHVSKAGRLRCFGGSCPARPEPMSLQAWTEQAGIDAAAYTIQPIADAPAEPSTPCRVAPSLEDARAELGQAIEAAIDAGARDRAVLIRSTPGVGKTEAALRAVKPKVDIGHRVLWTCSTRELVNYTALRAAGLGIPVHIIDGRNEENCRYFSECEAAGKRGFHPALSVCLYCEYSPRRKDGLGNCEYFERVEEAGHLVGRLIVSTHAQGFRLLEAGKLPKLSFIIIDEEPTAALLDERAIQAADIQKALDTWPELGPLCNMLLEALARAPGTDGKARRHAGPGIRALLEACIDDAGTLPELLQRAIDTAIKSPDIPADADAQAIMNAAPGYMPDFFRTLARELLNPDDVNRRVVLIAPARQRACFIFRRLLPVRARVPIVALDSYGQGIVYEQLLGRPVDTREVCAPINARVEFIRLNLSKRALRKQERFGALVEDYLLPELQDEADAGRKTLIFVHKARETELLSLLEAAGIKVAVDTGEGPAPAADVMIRHLWQGRGIDTYRDFDTVVHFADANPAPADIVDRAAAIFAGQPAIDARMDEHWQPVDQRLRAVLRAAREDEIRQNVFRVRPARDAADAPRRLIVFGKVLPSIPELLPGQVETIDDVRELPARRARARWEGAIREAVKRYGFWTEDKSFVFKAMRTSLIKRERQPGFLIRDVGKAFTFNDLPSRKARSDALARVVAELHLPEARVSVQDDAGTYRTFRVFGDADAGRAFLQARYAPTPAAATSGRYEGLEELVGQAFGEKQEEQQACSGNPYPYPYTFELGIERTIDIPLPGKPSGGVTRDLAYRRFIGSPSAAAPTAPARPSTDDVDDDTDDTS